MSTHFSHRYDTEQIDDLVNFDRSGYIQSMKALIGVVQQLSLAKDLDTIMDIVCHAVRTMTGAQGASFVLQDGEMSYYANGKFHPLEPLELTGQLCILPVQMK